MQNENSPSHRRLWGGMTTGLIVIVIGIVFLLRNLGIPLPFAGLHNWWALFILVGAIPMLAQAADRYRQSGRLDALVLHALLSASAVILVAAFFLLELDWSVWWPVFVIYGGLWMMLGVGKRHHNPN